MSIEEIKAEIAKLEPQEKEAWQKFKDAQAGIRPVENEWHRIAQRISNLRAAITILS